MPDITPAELTSYPIEEKSIADKSPLPYEPPSILEKDFSPTENTIVPSVDQLNAALIDGEIPALGRTNPTNIPEELASMLNAKKVTNLDMAALTLLCGGLPIDFFQK